MTKILIKRAYEPESPEDGFRIYIDRLWPRGMSHETFHYDLWDKEIAPTTELREWFHENPESRWNLFADKYKEYLQSLPAWNQLVTQVRKHPVVTLLYSSHDEQHNNAVVAEQLLQQQLKENPE